MSYLFLVLGDFILGNFVLGGYVLGGYVLGDFALGDSVLDSEESCTYSLPASIKSAVQLHANAAASNLHPQVTLAQI